MGREILFRGFCPDENGTQIAVVNGKKYKGNWVDGFYTWLPQTSIATAFLNNEFIAEAEDFDDYIIKPITKQSAMFSPAEPMEVCEIEQYKVIPETVGQFTGLTDKNGKKIFEWDRVRYGERIDFDCHEESIRYPEAYGGKIYDIGIFEDVVVWCGGNGYPAFDLENHDMECNALSVISEAGDYVIEVIGTVFDKEVV
jgi:hypothetical protein